MRKILLTILILFLYSYSAFAGCTGSSPTWTASADYASVAACVQSAQANDTINITAGTETWASTLSLGSKKLTINGDGIDSTVITAGAINIGTGGSSISRMTLVNCTVVVGGGGDSGFLVHHIKFNNATTPKYGVTVWFSGATHPKGVIYANEFINSYTHVSGTYTSADDRNAMWYASLDLGGTDNIVYIEGNTFTKNAGSIYIPVIDTNFGASVVFRYNTVNSTVVTTGAALYIENHATQSARSSKRFEVYNNVFNNTGGSMSLAARVRNGTGVQFRNQILGNYATKTIGLDVTRTASGCDGTTYGWDGNEAIANGTGTHTGGNSTTVLTDSTKTWTTNALVGMTVTNETDGGLTGIDTGSYCVITSNTSNTVTCAGLASGTWNENDEYKISNGYPCRDQIGRGSDASLWDDSPLAAHNQPLMPAYAWDNLDENSTQINFTESSTHLEPNRDYYNYNASFNGTVGIGRGLDAAKPVTCTTGVAYFSTDVGTLGTLYKCTATNTWSSYFTPATCPHPLADPSTQGSCDADAYGITGYTLTGGGSDVTAPTILSVYVNGADLTINFSESITATVGAAFTLDPSGADVTVSCPAVATAATSITCTISRALTAAETATYAYTGTKVIDVAENALAEITATAITQNLTPAEAPKKKLTITKTGTGCTITSSPSGISCGSTCEFDFTSGTSVTLGGYLENGWATITYSGGCAGGAADMTSDVDNCTVVCTPIYLLN